MAIAVEIVNKEQYRLTTEKIPDVSNSASWTWMTFRLIPGGDTGFAAAGGDVDITTFVKANTLYIHSPVQIKDLALFSLEGKLIHQKQTASFDFQIPLPAPGGGILKVSLEDGREIRRKVWF
jgi:hypothetical protein